MGKADCCSVVTAEQPAACLPACLPILPFHQQPFCCLCRLPLGAVPAVWLSVHLTLCSPSGCLPRLPPGPQFCAQVPAASADWRAGPRGAQPGWTPECEQGPGGG